MDQWAAETKRRVPPWQWALVWLFGCASPAASTSTGAGDAATTADLGAAVEPHTTPERPDAAMPPDTTPELPDTTPDTSPWLAAADYCETVVDAFCPYYLRCGRLDAPDEASCRAAFLETCNARYEPHYAAFEALGLLRLSRAGVAGCRLHLEHVECAAQVGDLDGACGAMWVGQAPALAPCGLGIESLVCAAGTTCVLGLDFCGSCLPESTDGTCDTERRCPDGGLCIEGACVTRLAAGDACTDADVCAVGLWCAEGRCRGPTIVAVGDACDADLRCPYKATCSGGKCVPLGLLGEPCTAGCASGFCDAGTCVPLRAAGEPCGASSQCVSTRCTEDGHCEPLGATCP